MKALLLIFTVYMVSLSVYPCYEDDCLEESSVANSGDNERHEGEDADLCTPFCISACCSVHVFCTPEVDSVTIAQNSTTENSAYILVFTPRVVVPIWQPPKLA